MQTHASWVFVAPPFVYKVKKPVRFAFLDFSTLELRRADCERELALNQRLAGDVYLGTEPIREWNGTLHFGGEGTIVEWAVKMREMDQERFLSHLLKREPVGTAEIDRVIEKLHAFYKSQPPLSAAEAGTAGARTLQYITGNLDQAREHVGHRLSPAAFTALGHYVREFTRSQQALLQSRAAEGRFRDCHGDLHLEHICLEQDNVIIYDCIEFNDALRHMDVACDLAFLAMDLDFNERSDLAGHMVEQFAQRLRDDGLARLMDFYKCYRASVRGMVESLHCMADGVEMGEEKAAAQLARRYYELALRYALFGSKPRLLVVMGKVASGKSTLAEALGKELGCSVLSSDRIRKTLAGAPLFQRGDAAQRSSLYAPEMTEKVYATLLQRAAETLRRGHSIILDATFSESRHREQLHRLQEQVGFETTWIETSAETEVVIERLRARDTMTGVVSDARVEDSAILNAGYSPPTEVPPVSMIRVRTQSEPSMTLHEVLQELALRNARR